jgi:hypothetical protein
MKYVASRPLADPAVAARKLLEIANATEAVDGRIDIEKITMSTAPRWTTPSPKAGSGSTRKGAITQAGAEPFA